MSLDLDARQRAMLEEMGVRVFDTQAPSLRAIDGTPPGPHRQAGGIADPRPAVINSPGQDQTPPAAAAVAASSLAPAPQAAAPVLRGPDAVQGANLPGVGPAEWEALEAAVASQLPPGCKAIFGQGDRSADWLVVGDVPVDEDEAQGLPFAGDAGRLLDNMLAALGASRRKGAYLTHALKWRPPGNRNPQAEEVAQCEPFLRRQVELLQPKIILAMGRCAVQMLLQTTEPVGKLRGRVHHYQDVPVVVTYHPAYLLRNQPDKARAWADLCLARAVVRAAS